MGYLEFTKINFERYLDLLKIKKKNPNADYLRQLIQSHLSVVPFENISKIYYYVTRKQNSLISFNQYLTGIEEYHFGGTCYTNNYYFSTLLNWLGFDVKLCGADMDTSNAHIVIIVTINDREFLVDTGYAAPFTKPIPCFLKEEFTFETGEYRYVFKPREQNEWQQLIFYKNDIHFHGYHVNPGKKSIADFSKSIAKSYETDATFMNSVLCTSLKNNIFYRVQNFEFLKFNLENNTVQKEFYNTVEELVLCLHFYFLIPENICKIALEKVFGQ